MTLGETILFYRKSHGWTQENLASQLEVTNQAVSKWETDLCCPDISLLPRLADLFEISMDQLFDRHWERDAFVSGLPWEDDGVLRAVLFSGRNLLQGQKAAAEFCFCYDGPVMDLHSDFSVQCDNVFGSVHAGGSVTCDAVGGNIQAGGSVTCDAVAGDVHAGGNVTCDDVSGSVRAGCQVTCDTIYGTAQAGICVRSDRKG